jgi:hypothetical protein
LEWNPLLFFTGSPILASLATIPENKLGLSLLTCHCE